MTCSNPLIWSLRLLFKDIFFCFTEWKWESAVPFRPWNFPSFWIFSVPFLPCFQTDHLFSNSSISCQMHPIRTNWNCYILFACISLSCKFTEDTDHHPSTSVRLLAFHWWALGSAQLILVLLVLLQHLCPLMIFVSVRMAWLYLSNRNSKISWLMTTKVSFLLSLHVHYGVAIMLLYALLTLGPVLMEQPWVGTSMIAWRKGKR